MTADGKILGYFDSSRSVPIQSTAEVSPWVLRSLIATEDRNFYQHDGVSMKGLGRAIIMSMTGSKQGGSTITMQLARTLYLNHEKTISRKLTEMRMARELENQYTKNEILVMFLNSMYYGHGCTGIQSAANEYFGKSARDLNEIESALIVGLLNAPSAYDPTKAPQKALSRRNAVLHNMVETGDISAARYNILSKQKLSLNMRKKVGGYFLESVRREAEEILRRRGLNLHESGYIVYTTIDTRVQEAAEKAVQEHWKQYSSLLKDAQLGLVSVEPKTGYVRAMIGGNPKSNASGLNHTNQIRRQPGSSFKPFLYGKMLDMGYSLAFPLNNEPISIDDGSGKLWQPQNDDKSTSGPVPLQYAVKHSLNLASAYSVTRIINPDSIVSFARQCGIQSNLLAVPSLALGTSTVSPIEMANSYAVFASNGILAKTILITKIVGPSGRIVYRETPTTTQAVSPQTCYLITTALQQVIQGGTGYQVRAYYKRPVAGKTGTTQDNTDAWFVGYNPALSTAIWIGNDDATRKLNRSFGYGGLACAPIFGKMMARLTNTPYAKASLNFAVPDSIQTLELCEDTGKIAGPKCTRKKPYPVNMLIKPSVCHEH